MSSEYQARPARTERLDPIVAAEPVAGPDPGFGPDPAAGEPDPLAKVTLTPRGFAALLATIALLVGLILAVVPVLVAGPDPTSAASVGCGNTIGGVETGAISADLGQPDRTTLVSYVDICERAVSNRVLYSWPLFFGGGLMIIYLGVVRRPQRSMN
jgi:hypothetical protein